MSVRILQGDCRDILPTLPAESVQCCVTSPPYFGLRDYGHTGQIGLEQTPEAYVAELVAVFREVRRVLRDDASLWLNIGDSYAGSRCGPQGASGQMADRSIAGQRVRRSAHGKHIARGGAKAKDLLMIPAMVALALRADGWYLRSDIIWHKPNPMPESCTDRPTSAHEHVFLFSKSPCYYYDAAAIREAWADDRCGKDGSKKSRERNRGGRSDGYNAPAGIDPSANGGRNSRNVWTIASQPYAGAHSATMPPTLAERCILAGSKKADNVLDPFGGSGTTGMVADRLQRRAVLIEINPASHAEAHGRIVGDASLFAEVVAS